MLSTSIDCVSGGCGAMLNGSALASPGNRTASTSERSALVVTPSTASGPRMLLSRCATFGNERRFSWPGWMSKYGSAMIGTVTCEYQVPVSILLSGDGGV